MAIDIQESTSSNGEKIIKANGVDICIEPFGNPANPAILLINGNAASMDWWEDEFCDRLAGGSRFVIRYDHRDTGRSISYEPGAPDYSQADLAADAVGILDSLGREQAHVVGMSMGGGLGQRLGVERPERVASLTLISTSPGGPGDPSNPDLPSMSEELQAMFSEDGPEPDWSDREAVIAYLIDGERAFAGTIPIDEPRLRAIAERLVDRTVNIQSSMTNHWMIEGGDHIRSRLGEITVPTLVMHGTADPLLPYGHGEALASAIPGSRLIPLEGGGHQMPHRQLWDVVIPAILEHTSRGP